LKAQETSRVASGYSVKKSYAKITEKSYNDREVSITKHRVCFVISTEPIESS